MHRNPVIYLRSTLAEEAEQKAAAKYFDVVDHRGAIKPHSLVVPRYSALPFYQELEADMGEIDCELINTWREHCYVADIRNWYYHLADVTPKTWFALDQAPVEGPFVVKGATNSKKFQWNTHMFAPNRYQAIEIASKLSQDSMLGTQPVYIREYVPLKQLAMGLNGLPISEEYRFFVLDGKVVDSGFYWSSHVDDLDDTYTPDVVPQEFIDKVINAVKDHVRFWVFDVARTAAGDWIVVELNDGQQSGLSEIDPDNFYKTLRDRLC